MNTVFVNPKAQPKVEHGATENNPVSDGVEGMNLEPNHQITSPAP